MDFSGRQCSGGLTETAARGRKGDECCQKSGRSARSQVGLACCEGPRPLVFCIETDRRARWCLLEEEEGLLGLVEAGGGGDEVIALAARQRAKGGTACGQVEQLGATNTHEPPPV